MLRIVSVRSLHLTAKSQVDFDFFFFFFAYIISTQDAHADALRWRDEVTDHGNGSYAGTYRAPDEPGACQLTVTVARSESPRFAISATSVRGGAAGAT